MRIAALVLFAWLGLSPAALGAERGTGVGLAVGHPSGVVAKHSLAAPLALQGGIGTGTVEGEGLYVTADLVWSPAVLARRAAYRVPLYLGGGLRFYDDHHDRASRWEEGRDQHIGVRVPLGLAIELARTPLDVFVELAVAFDVVVDDHCRLCEDDDRAGLSLTLGVRYWFGGAR